MANFQLPPLKNAETFEHFVCDLFNCIEKTNSYISYQLFGVKGQDQKGIDVFSQITKTGIQCKLKDVRAKDDVIRKKLIVDIEDTLEKIKNLNFKFERVIIASTFRDDSQIQEFLNQFHSERNYDFSIYYWGWDTLTNYAENESEILDKYFSKFIKKPNKASKSELPDGAIGKNLEMKNYFDYLRRKYGDWKQMELTKSNEKFNWASFNKHLMNKYRVAGIYHIPISKFDDVVLYLQKRIDGTIFGKNRKSKGNKNDSNFNESIDGKELL
jgi:hypothetical protein